MLKVLLVDDEPFILQGLKVLVNWEEEGFEVYTANDGQAALDVLNEHKMDLVIADIKMPGMNGIDLLKNIRESGNDVYFVILSGYAEFSYAQEALRYHCNSYILKPVEKDNLLGILQKVIKNSKDKESAQIQNNKLIRAYFEQNLRAAFRGKHNDDIIEYLTDKLPDNGAMRYVGIELDIDSDNGDYLGQEKNSNIMRLYDIAADYLADYDYLLVRDGFGDENVYDVGFLYLHHLAQVQGDTDEDYLSRMLEHLKRVSGLPIVMLVGRTVNGIEAISKSFTSVNMLHSLHGFREKKDIYFYEEEYQITDKGILLCKSKLDELISAIELNEQAKIKQKVDEFHSEMKKTGITGKTMNLNINYLLFQLIHIATEQDSEVNQEEILRLISENAYEQGIKRGSKTHLYRMACEYGDYLAMLRKKESKGVLAKIEDEVKNNFASNITLKELSEKYYVNSAYLGQLFRKKYGCSFKDYLNDHRLNEAAMLLRKTDEKIYIIAEKVGYKDVDYFVNKFIEAKGCTPAKYRKQEQ